jgi:hypothetical protein
MLQETNRVQLIELLSTINSFSQLRSALKGMVIPEQELVMVISKLSPEQKELLSQCYGLNGELIVSIDDIAINQRVTPDRILQKVAYCIKQFKLGLESYDSRFNPIGREPLPQNPTLAVLIHECRVHAYWGLCDPSMPTKVEKFLLRPPLPSRRRAISGPYPWWNAEEKPYEELACDDLCQLTKEELSNAVGIKVRSVELLHSVLAIFSRAIGDRR